MSPISPSPADKASAGTKLPPALHLAAKHEEHFSLGKQTKECFFSDSDYATLSAQRFMNIGLGSRLLLRAPGPGMIGSAYLSLLSIPGAILRNSLDTEQVGLVLQVTEYGALVWRGSLHTLGGFTHLRLGKGLQWDQFIVFDADKWEVYGLKSRLPHWVRRRHHIDASRLSGLQCVSLEVIGSAESSLLKFSARRGIPFMTLAFLHRLVDLLGFRGGGRRLTLLLNVVRELVSGILGDLSEEEWQAIVACEDNSWASRTGRARSARTPTL